ncbi:MAG: TonB family protein [Alphaproteobacteria bacterium]|nr:TonB family protein [Alphaproteobacteria bacterium]
MAYTIHPRLTTQDTLKRYVGLSFGAHVVALLLLTFTIGHTARLAPPQAVKVQLVGVPIPAMPSKPKEIEEIRTQDSPAPKEPPPNMKSMPESEATTKLAEPVSATPVVKESDIAAAERPPVLDKTPREKKVVKNKPDAKVVKNPEDFLAQLDFVDALAKQAAKPTPNAKPSTQQAGEGPRLQLNLADGGIVNAIRDHISRNWLIPPGLDVRGLTVTVQVSLDEVGNLTGIYVTRSSGQQFFDNSLLRAVQKAMPLPIPANELPNFRDIELTFQQP